MKQPIWIRERIPATPPPISFLPVLKRRKRGGKSNRGIQIVKDDSARIEVIIMRYPLLLLILSISVLKA